MPTDRPSYGIIQRQVRTFVCLNCQSVMVLTTTKWPMKLTVACPACGADEMKAMTGAVEVR